MKKLASVISLQKESPASGFTSYSLFHQQHESMNPYLVLTDFTMKHAFFPPHPHAGFSVMTYLFTDSEGAFINRDSFGDNSRIEPGGLHYTQAAAGIMHEEINEVEGQICHGLQLWINLPGVYKNTQPKAFHANAQEIPEHWFSGGYARILLGSLLNKPAAIAPIGNNTILDVHLEPNAGFKHKISEGHTSFVYIIKGAVNHSDAGNIPAHHVLFFSNDGSDLQIQATNSSVNFLFFSGEPIHEPIVHGGPFVMNNPEEISAAKKRYTNGEMGRLSPSPIFNL